MARVWLPPQSDPWLALREPALLVPEALPLGNVKPRQCLKPVSVLILRPGQETRDLCGFRWLKGGTPSFAWRTEIAANPLGVQGDIIQSPAFYSMLCSSTSNYLYSQHPPLRDLPLGNEFTFTGLSYQSNGGISAPAAFGWSGTDDLILYKARSISSPPNTPTVFWRDIGGIVLVPSVAADALYNWSVETVVGRVNGANIDLSLYSNGVLIASNSVSAAGRGPFTQMELGRWESQTMGNTSAVSMFGAFSRAWSAAEVEAHARDVFGYLIEPAANEPIFIGTAAGGGAFTLTADAASYSLTGQDAALTAARTVTAESTAYNYTGQDAGLLAGLVVPADSTAYTYNAADVGLVATRVLTADSVSYTYTGQNATLTYTPAAKILTAESTSYTYTAADAALAVGFHLGAESTSYALTGQEATLRATRTLPADATSYTYIGQDANLIYTAVGAFTLVADPASFLLTAQDVALTATRAVPADLVVYSWSGQDANLSTGFGLVADQATYTYTPADATFSRTYVASAEAVAYVLTGQAVTFRYSGTPVWIEVASATGVWTETPSAGGTWTEIN